MLWMGLKPRCGFSPTYRSSFKGWLMCTAPSQVPRYVPWCLVIQEIISSRTTSSSVTDRLKAKPQNPACFATVALQGCPGNNFEDHTVHFSKTKGHPPWTPFYPQNHLPSCPSCLWKWSTRNRNTKMVGREKDHRGLTQ